MNTTYRWKYINGEFVTVRIDAKGNPVDIRRGTMSYSQAQDGTLNLHLSPQEGIDAPGVVLFCKVIACVWSDTQDAVQIRIVSVHFDNQAINLNLEGEQKLYLLPISAVTTHVVDPAKVAVCLAIWGLLLLFFMAVGVYITTIGSFVLFGAIVLVMWRVVGFLKRVYTVWVK